MAQKANVKLVDADGVVNPVTGGVGQAVDGRTVAAGNVVLLIHPPNGDAYAGPWVAASGAWSRVTDWDAPADITLGDEWYVEDGVEYTGTKWHFDDDAVPTSLNTDLLTISQLTRRRALDAGSGVEIKGTTPPVISHISTSDVESTFAEGLKVEYLTANSLRVGNGAAYIPASGVANVETDIDITGMTLTASTFYYLYAYDAGGGVLAVEYSPQRPATAYRGGARVKGGGTGGALDNTNPDIQPDNTRRYIPNSAFYASATNVIRKFQKTSDTFTRWLVDLISTARVVSASQATSSTDVDISAWCPPGSTEVEVNLSFVNSDNTSTFYVTAVGDGLQTSGGTDNAGQLSVIVGVTTPRQHITGPIALFGATRSLRHRQTAIGASRSGSVDIIGYRESR